MKRLRSIAGTVVTGAFIALATAGGAVKMITKKRQAQRDGGDATDPEVEQALEREGD